jgi:hypothetical protein
VRGLAEVMASAFARGNMTNRFLLALVVLFSFAGATLPASALPFPAAPSTCGQQMPLALSFLSEKARGMVTGRNASSSSVVGTKPMGFPAIADIRMACAGSMAIKGSATTKAPEAANKISPMVKTDPWCTWNLLHSCLRLSQSR